MMQLAGFSTRRLGAVLGMFAAAATFALVPAASAQFDRQGVVTPTAPFTWTGPVATGHNEDYNGQSGQPCGKTEADYCDATLVNVQAGDFFETSGGGVEFSIADTPPNDFDLYVYASDAAGTRGPLVGASAGPTDVESTAIINANGYYLVRVIYWDVTMSGYQGRAEFFRRAKFPPDVDRPRGLQDILASNPFKGFRSHSEMHAAQSPIDEDDLIAASKFYNRDPDSLAEYEFKLGSYLSLDHGRRWFDLGQTNVCPQSQAPPSTWPLANTCYPADDPAREGTGPEDVPPGGDFGEEYIVSDPWVDWDDEGNAYLMALDSPPFPTGAGWGMSFHRWRTPSLFDVLTGRTWSDRIVINAYETPEEQAAFLDDKNTFAVNNAGRDRDGRTGIIVACWGQNGPVLADRGPQQIVCERSTDGGLSWPGEPIPVSPGAQRLVIGVHVVADTRSPQTFYAVWLEYLSGIVSGTGTNTLQFSKSTDGGLTWSAASTIQTIVPLPRIFPRQAFRNLSLPIVAVGPRSELYVAYADYNPATGAADVDGMQADIKVTRSLDGGAAWSAPVKVNQDTGDADQFQPYIRATESGQLNVFFFDRRYDPDNFFIDNFLARSGDGGATWRETRLSHDMWDPSINPPISPSGEFIGDYQGLVADDCYAIPFVNDTHLANDPRRDPAFDRRLPRSPFQEAISYRVPNRHAYGGDARRCRHGHRADKQRLVSRRGDRRIKRTLAGVSRAEARELAAKHQIIVGGGH
jgi:hypothetical protein